MAELSFHDGELRWGPRRAARAEVRGFMERYGRWSGRAWLEVVGPGWRLPIDGSYGEHRRALRQWFPDLPFDSEWLDGRFPGRPLGLPPATVTALGAGSVALAAVLAGLVTGPWAGLAVALAGAWPVMRLRDGVVVRPAGVRAGPPWAPLVPWHEVEEVGLSRGAVRSRVWLRGSEGGGAATVPTVLLPALRARLIRLGAIDLVDDRETVDDRYLRWRAPAAGIPWGVLVGGVVVSLMLPTPWVGLLAAVAGAAATGLLGAMVEARATGWGMGSVLAGLLLYALALLAVSLSGWL